MCSKTRRKSSISRRRRHKRDDSGISSLESLSWILPGGKGVYISDDERTDEEESESTRDSVFGSPRGPVLSTLGASSSLVNGKTPPLRNGRLPSTPRLISLVGPKESTPARERSAERRPKDAAEPQPIVYLANHCEEILKKLSKDPGANEETPSPKIAIPRIFKEFQTQIRHLLESAGQREFHQRQALYRTLSFLDVVDELVLSVFCIRTLVDCVLELVERAPHLSLFCAEYCKAQVDSAGPDWQRHIFEAILRSIRSRYLQRGSTLRRDELRRRRFVYTTLLGHFYVVGLLSSTTLYNYVAELIQPGRDETEIDSLTYAVRLLSIVGWVWDAEGEDHQIQLTEWYCLLARIVNCPPPLKFDVQRLLARRPMGHWKLGSYHRADDFETRQWLDDVVFRTRNSFGRGLNASKELLAVYSPYFHKFFFANGRSSRREQHEVFIGVEFYVFREILSILYSVKRVFTADRHCSYDTVTLVQLFYAAKQLDIPLVRRMCREQLEEKPPLEAALVAQSLEMEEIVTIALRRMCPRDMRLFLENGNREATLSARDVFTAVRKIVPLKYRRLKPPTKPLPRSNEVMFPSDFLSPWPLSDVIIRTWYADGRALYANSTVLCLYSNSFARNMEQRRLSYETRAMEIGVDVDYSVMLAILKAIHHVDRKFSFGDHRIHGRGMLFALLKAAALLEMPIIARLCEDQIRSLDSGEQFAIAQMAGISDEILCDCSSPGRLIEEIRMAVAMGAGGPV